MAKEPNKQDGNSGEQKSNPPSAPTQVAPAAAAPVVTQANTQGRAIILPNNERRVDFIKRRYKELTADPATKAGARGKIVKELKAMGHEVAYQIVFAATKGM